MAALPAAEPNAWMPADWKVYPPPALPACPTLFVAGDSTAAASGGWATPLATFFDTNRVNVCNYAKSGASSRTFYNDGWWGQIMGSLKAGDFVLIQFGHNDASPVNEAESVPESARRSRGSIPGTGDDTKEIDNIVTKKHEVIHTFGWYLRTMISEVRAKGATPFLLSRTVRNQWDGDKLQRDKGDFGKWTGEVAAQTKTGFVDLSTLIADEYERRGKEAVAALFPKDPTHPSKEGSELNASFAVAGLRALKGNPFEALLSEKGKGALLPK